MDARIGVRSALEQTDKKSGYVVEEQQLWCLPNTETRVFRITLTNDSYTFSFITDSVPILTPQKGTITDMG